MLKTKQKSKQNPGSGEGSEDTWIAGAFQRSHLKSLSEQAHPLYLVCPVRAQECLFQVSLQVAATRCCPGRTKQPSSDTHSVSAFISFPSFGAVSQLVSAQDEHSELLGAQGPWLGLERSFVW